MKKRWSSRTKASLAILLLVTTLLGCAQGGANNGSSNSAGANSPNSNSSGNHSKSETEQPSDTTSSKPVEFTILLRTGSEFIPENNAWVDAINEKANAKITWMVIPIANIWEKRNVLLASGDYPEVIIMDPPLDNMYEQMVKNNVLLPVDDYLENAPNLMNYTHKSSFDAVRDDDGKLYMIPRSTIIREDFMGVRKDWLDALSLSTPQTTEDWREFYRAVSKNDPDGNGKADTYGVTESSEMMTIHGTINLDYFARAWHADKQWYDNGNGELFYGVFAKDGRFKKAMEFYRQLAQDGSLDPDLITNKGVSAKEDKFNRGVTASMRMFAGNLDRNLSVLRNIHADAEIELVDYPSAPDSELYVNEQLIQTNAGIYNGWALTDKAKGKEAEIIRVLDWMLSDEGWDILKNGVEGVHHMKDGDTVVPLEPEYGNFSKWIGHLMLFRRPNDEDLWLKRIIPETYNYQKEWLDKSVQFIQDNYKQEGLLGIVSETETEFYKSELYTKQYVETVAKIIYGELPLSAWDDFLEKVYKNGWEKVTQEYNDYYKNHK